jgi:hypothetical protein
MMANVTGRPEARLTSSIHASSATEFCRSGPSRSPMRGTTSIVPRPRVPSAAAMAPSSSGRANVPGTGRPSGTVCRKLREDENPSAPASTASPTSAAMRAMSSSVAGASSRLRGPMT